MSHDPSQRKDQEAPPQLLTRSRIEIAKILDAVARINSPVTAYLDNGEQMLVTQVRHVDPVAGYIVLDYGLSKPANAMLLSAKSVMLHCKRERMHVQFLALAPVEIAYEGKPAIRLNFPEYVLQQDQRAHSRVKIPPQLRLKCIVDCPGFISFELEVVDISRAGQGTVLHNPNIKLEPGTVLTGCRISHPLRRPISVDLEIRYAIRTQLPDGTIANRVGCQFRGDTDEIAELIKMFSVTLDDTESR